MRPVYYDSWEYKGIETATEQTDIVQGNIFNIIAYNGKESEKKIHIHVYMRNFCCIPKTL